MILFGRKSVTARSSPRFTISESCITSSRQRGTIITCWLSEYALEKFEEHGKVRVKIVRKGSNEIKRIDNYIIENIYNQLKFVNRKICSLTEIRRLPLTALDVP